MAVMSFFKDRFDGIAFNTSLWVDASGSGGVVSMSGGKLILTPATSTASTRPELDSFSNHDMTSGTLTVRVLQVASQECQTSFIFGTPTNQVYLEHYAGTNTLRARQVVASVYSTLASVGYDSTTMAWWRIRELSGTTYWEYAAEQYGPYTVLHSATNPIAMTAAQVILQVFDAASDAAPGAAWFSNLNSTKAVFNNRTLRPYPFAPGLAR